MHMRLHSISSVQPANIKTVWLSYNFFILYCILLCTRVYVSSKVFASKLPCKKITQILMKFAANLFTAAARLGNSWTIHDIGRCKIIVWVITSEFFLKVRTSSFIHQTEQGIWIFTAVEPSSNYHSIKKHINNWNLITAVITRQRRSLSDYCNYC